MSSIFLKKFAFLKKILWSNYELKPKLYVVEGKRGLPISFPLSGRIYFNSIGGLCDGAGRGQWVTRSPQEKRHGQWETRRGARRGAGRWRRDLPKRKGAEHGRGFSPNLTRFDIFFTNPLTAAKKCVTMRCMCKRVVSVYINFLSAAQAAALFLQEDLQ